MFTVINNPIVRQYAVVIVVNLSVLCTGLGTAWPSPVLVKLMDSNETTLSRVITEEEGSWIVSIGYLVGAIGNFLPALVLGCVGRKTFVMATVVPRLVTGGLMIFATEPWHLLLARALSGLTDGFIFSVVPMYASEVASVNIRGSLGTILQIMCSLGIVIMLCLGPYVSYITLNVFVTCANAVAFIPLMFLPETPYYHYSKGHNTEAIKVLTFLRGSEELAQEELKGYALSKTDTKVSTRELLRNRAFMKALQICAIIGMGTQLVGFNAVTFYLQTVLESTQTSVKPETASVIIGLIQLSAAVCTTIVSDRFGRKPILSTTLVGMTLGMVGLGAFFKLKEITDHVTGFMNYLPLISLILVVFCFSAGLGSVSWPLSAELFSDESRALGMMLFTNLSLFFIFITTKYFALVTSSIGPAATYWAFSFNCVLLSAYILLCIPETKGKTIAEVQDILSANSKSKRKDEENI